MDKIGTKTLKILLFIGVFAYLQYYDVKHGFFSVSSVTDGLIATSAVYLIASLFGIVLSLTCNYLIAIIVTGALALSFAYKLDDLIASVSWLTENRVLCVLCGLAISCLIRDIMLIRNCLYVPPENTNAEPLSSHTENAYELKSEPIKTAQQVCKETPSMMMKMSKQLEKQIGHKPTYEELVDYVDNKAFHFPDDNEISQEVKAMVEAARQEVRQRLKK